MKNKFKIINLLILITIGFNSWSMKRSFDGAFSQDHSFEDNRMEIEGVGQNSNDIQPDDDINKQWALTGSENKEAFTKAFPNSQNFTPLHVCAALHLPNFIECFKIEPNIDQPDSQGLTPLHYGCLSNFTQAITLLLNAKAKPDTQDILGQTPLHKAAEKNNVQAIALLLDHKANINSQNDRGYTPLHLAVENENIDAINFLIHAKADVDLIDDDERSPIFTAIRKKNYDICKLLLLAGANINIIDIYDKTPLDLAVKAGNQMLKFLLQFPQVDKAIKNSEISSPLITAVANKELECIETLLNAGANINSCNNLQETPLTTAAELNSKILALLLKYNPNINAQDENGFTALYLACMQKKLKNVKLLLKAGADVNIQTNKEETPLYLCLGQNNYLRELLNNKPKPNLEVYNNHRNYLLSSASYCLEPNENAAGHIHNELTTLLCLIQAGASIENAIQAGIQQGYEDDEWESLKKIKNMLKTAVFVKDVFNHFLQKGPHQMLIDKLAKARINLNIGNINNVRLIDIAARQGNLLAMAYLMFLGAKCDYRTLQELLGKSPDVLKIFLSKLELNWPIFA